MKLSYFTQADHINPSSADLFLEINALGLCYIILENADCKALAVYDFNEGIYDEAAAAHIHQVISSQPVLQEGFNRVHIVYGYAPSVLVPEELMGATDIKPVLDLVYGDTSQSVIMDDIVPDAGIHNIYGIPSVIEMVIRRYFPTASCHHLFSLLPGIVKETGNQLLCLFETGQLRVVLVKYSRLQLVQTYAYRTSVDVAYHLLMVCKAFDVNVSNTSLKLTGKIDVNSTLYSELHKYFLQLHFEKLPGQYQYPAEISQQPEHYYSHLFAIAASL